MRFLSLSTVVLVSLGALVGCATSELDGVSNVHTVEPGVLIRGGQPDADGFALLRERYGIRTVVNLNADTAAGERAMVESLGMGYVAIPSSAFDPDREKVGRFLALMGDAGVARPVFVHCRQGMDRAGTAVAAWRIVGCGWDARRALAELDEHQAAFNGLVFAAIIPRFVRSIEAERGWWLAASERTDAPTTQPASAAHMIGDGEAVSDVNGREDTSHHRALDAGVR